MCRAFSALSAAQEGALDWKSRTGTGAIELG
jgi:hypothetical protein